VLFRSREEHTAEDTRESLPKARGHRCLRAADQMTEEQPLLFDRISSTQCPDVIELRQMALAFRTALTAGESGKLRQWIEGARRCEYGAVVRFAYGLQKDLSAVSAAVETSWSTGQVEGQINRLKMIKRQMYGRAGFELLRARVLPYSPVTSPGRAREEHQICGGANFSRASRRPVRGSAVCHGRATKVSGGQSRPGRDVQLPPDDGNRPKVAATQKALEKTDPDVARPGGTIKTVNDIVQRMQASPAVMSALWANNLSPRDYALER